jgi:hypothetical protein
MAAVIMPQGRRVAQRETDDHGTLVKALRSYQLLSAKLGAWNRVFLYLYPDSVMRQIH